MTIDELPVGKKVALEKNNKYGWTLLTKVDETNRFIGGRDRDWYDRAEPDNVFEIIQREGNSSYLLSNIHQMLNKNPEDKIRKTHEADQIEGWDENKCLWGKYQDWFPQLLDPMTITIKNPLHIAKEYGKTTQISCLACLPAASEVWDDPNLPNEGSFNEIISKQCLGFTRTSKGKSRVLIKKNNDNPSTVKANTYAWVTPIVRINKDVEVENDGIKLYIPKQTRANGLTIDPEEYIKILESF